jgi:hypothetical protein
MSKRSAVLHFAIASAFVITGHQAFGQAAPAAGAAGKPAYSELPVNPKYHLLPPEVVAENEAAATENAQKSRDQTLASNNARKVLLNQIPFDDAGKKLVDEWYKTYLLPSFTLKENIGKLPEMRNDLVSKDLRSAKQPAAVTYVRGLVMTYMKAFAQSPGTYNFHPAVRYNAMLVIGDLNVVEYGARYASGQKAMVPEPLPEALDLLIAEYKSPTQIDAVRVAALVGLDRHVKLDLGRPVEGRIPGPKKKVIFDEMLALLNAAPPATRSPEGHTWMQRRAIDILAAMGVVGLYPEVSAALGKIAADKGAPMSLRCTASEALAQWPQGNNKVDATAVSKNLGLIAVKACQDELDRIAALVKQEEEMKQLRELIKKPNPAATGQFGSMPGSAGGAGGEMMMMEGMYGDAAGMADPSGSMMGGSGEMEMYGMMGMGGYGGMPGSPTAVPTDPRIVWSQRRLKYQLTCVKRGLSGMAIAGKASPHEKVVAQITKAVEAALVLTDPPPEKPDLTGLTESIQKGLNGLAFLAPEAAVIDVEPVTGLPPGAEPVAPAAPPSTPAPAGGPGIPPATEAAPGDAPPGV